MVGYGIYLLVEYQRSTDSTLTIPFFKVSLISFALPFLFIYVFYLFIFTLILFVWNYVVFCVWLYSFLYVNQFPYFATAYNTDFITFWFNLDLMTKSQYIGLNFVNLNLSYILSSSYTCLFVPRVSFFLLSITLH